MSVSEELKQKIDEWLEWDKNEETLSTINDLIKTENYDELKKLLLNRLSFGTAGLRGRMAAGYSAMNDLVIIQTGQGLLKYLESNQKDLLESNGIVIGYDGRHNSKRFAELTASIFLHSGYKVRLFGNVVPTPFIPFTVSKYKCVIGIMITASHNPKDDNGYKVYGSNSSQIISPVDKKIQESILNNLKPLDTSWDLTILTKNNKLLTNPLEEVFQSYLNKIDENILLEHKELNKKSKLLFTYSAMHGVGYEYIKKVFELIGVKMVVVSEQRDPHPDFPTVKFPNPEEGKSSLDLSFKTADKAGSTIIIANDPDADRMAVAEKNPRTGEWKVFTGNELGALLGWWLLYCFKSRYPNEPLDNVYMLSSTVSSMILKTMSKIDGFNFIETLTGFKWMGNKSYELLNDNKKVVFAYEEAIGFMCGSTVLDKDGISAASQLATLASYLDSKQKSLCDKLEEIYQNYGYHISKNSYFICYDKEKICKIFERIRKIQLDNYPTGILKDKYKICSVRDLTTGFDSSQPDKKAILPVSKSSQMITFNFTNGLVCTLRTSGTEPKIKYYTELCASPNETNREVLHNTLNEMVEGIVEELLQPKENQLIVKSD